MVFNLNFYAKDIKITLKFRDKIKVRLENLFMKGEKYARIERLKKLIDRVIHNFIYIETRRRYFG